MRQHDRKKLGDGGCVCMCEDCECVAVSGCTLPDCSCCNFDVTVEDGWYQQPEGWQGI